MIRSSSLGKSGLMRTGAVGAEFRIALKVAADVVPRNGSVAFHAHVQNWFHPDWQCVLSVAMVHIGIAGQRSRPLCETIPAIF